MRVRRRPDAADVRSAWLIVKLVSPRGLYWLALLLCAGCDRVFGLDRDVDAGLPIDGNFDASLAMCPPEYQPVPGAETRYLFVPTLRMWPEAQADCADDSPDSITHLVEFTDHVELEAVRTAVPFPSSWNAWTGYARDTGSNPYVFFASTGPVLPLGSPVWAPMEPDGPVSVSEETVTFFNYEHAVADGPPTLEAAYICECDGRPVTRTFAVLP